MGWADEQNVRKNELKKEAIKWIKVLRQKTSTGFIDNTVERFSVITSE